MPRHLMAAGAVALLIALSGCGEPDIVVPPSPTPSATPLFASEEEALAAAVAAYGEYLAVSDAIAADGGLGSERIAPLVTPAFLEVQSADFATLSASGRRAEGSTSFDSAEIQQIENDNVSLYLCVDVTNVRIFDGAGIEVTPTARINRVHLEVRFKKAGTRLLLDSSTVWEGGTKCVR